MIPRVTTSLILLASLMLAGCGSRAEQLWDDYLARLSRLTGQAVPEATPGTLQRYPRHRELSRPVSELRTGLVGFLDLGKCDMRALVSERNAILSRVQVDSLRLDYELRFLERGRACLAEGKLDDEPDTAEWLRDILDSKASSLPSLFWNISLAGEEVAGLFSLASDAPQDGEIPGSQNAYRSLDALTRLGKRLHDRDLPPPADADTLEEDLRQLVDNRAGGKLLHGMALARDRLARAAWMLEQTDSERLCPHGLPGNEARYLKNVFDAVYAADIQPWLAGLWRAMDNLVPSLLALRDAQPLASTALDEWLANHFRGPGSLREQTNDALMRHTRAWQGLLNACGLAPQRNK